MTNEKRFVYQIINAENGNRSKPFEGSWDQIAEVMNKNRESIQMKDYVLLVAAIDPESDDKQLVIPQSPLITIGAFLELAETANKEKAEA